MSRLIITAGIGSPWLQLSVLARLIIQAMERSQSYVTSDNNPRIGNASADSETSSCRRPLHAPEATSDNNSLYWIAMAAIIGLLTSDNTSHHRAPEPPHV